MLGSLARKNLDGVGDIIVSILPYLQAALGCSRILRRSKRICMKQPDIFSKSHTQVAVHSH